jgi:UDP-N-acetylmuramoylalanine-D-glutamate ligase
VEADPYEKENVLSKFHDIAKRMQGFAEKHHRQFYNHL